MSTNVVHKPRFSVSSNNIKQFNKSQNPYKNFDFIEHAKKSINKSELVDGEFYIILSQLTSNFNLELNDKIAVLSLKSFIYFKSNNEYLSNNVLRKTMKLFEFKEKVSKENHIAFVRIFYRSGMIFFENRKFFLALQCFYYAKNILSDDNGKDNEIRDLIRNKYNEAIKEISRIVINRFY